MNGTFPSNQISKTGKLGAQLKLRHYKLDLITRFIEFKSINPKIRQDQKAKELSYSSSILQRCRPDKKNTKSS